MHVTKERKDLLGNRDCAFSSFDRYGNPIPFSNGPSKRTVPIEIRRSRSLSYLEHAIFSTVSESTGTHRPRNFVLPQTSLRFANQELLIRKKRRLNFSIIFPVLLFFSSREKETGEDYGYGCPSVIRWTRIIGRIWTRLRHARNGVCFRNWERARFTRDGMSEEEIGAGNLE